MINDQDVTPIIRTWMEQPTALPRDGLQKVLADVDVTEQEQRLRWWPIRRRMSDSATGFPSSDIQPIPTLAANDHVPTVAGRTTPMFSLAKFVVAGAIVALFGGLLLIGQSFDQPRDVPGAAPSELGTVSPTGSLTQPRQGHTATLLPDGRVLVLGGWDGGYGTGIASAEIWDPATGTFGPAGSLAEPREEHSATLLPDGRVLIIGTGIASAEIWDPATGTFGPAGSLAVRREEHTATLLPDGRVLVGGVATAEVWDPATNTFSSAGSDTFRSWHTVTALLDGRVLVLGGRGGLGAGDLAEVWDPTSNTVSPAGSHSLGRGRHTTTLLSDGRVLVVGSGHPSPASVWDPATSTFSLTGSSTMDWINSATLLPDGRVLVSGDGDPNSTEVWDPDTGTFGPAGSLLAVESYYETTILPDGRVLIVGGCIGECYGGPRSTEDNNSVLASVELWDPVTDTFGAAGSLSEARTGHSATPLHDGRVLVVGGWGGVGRDVHASAEIWAPSDP